MYRRLYIHKLECLVHLQLIEAGEGGHCQPSSDRHGALSAPATHSDSSLTPTLLLHSTTTQVHMYVYTHTHTHTVSRTRRSLSTGRDGKRREEGGLHVLKDRLTPETTVVLSLLSVG